MSVKLEQVDDDTLRVEIGGRAWLVAAACPHRKGRLLHGYVNEKALRITCPLHASTFDLTTGRHLAGPECASLRTVELNPEAPRAAACPAAAQGGPTVGGPGDG